MSSATSASTRCLSPLPIAAKKPLTISMFSSMLIESLLSFIKRFRWNGTFRNHPSRPNHTVTNQLLLLLEQVLKNQLPPGAAACVHEPSALVQLSQLDGCEPQFFNQVCHGSNRIVIVARQKDNPVPSLDLRIGRQFGRTQVIEALYELGAGE